MRKFLFSLLFLCVGLLAAQAQAVTVEKSVLFYGGEHNGGAWHSWSGSPLLTLSNSMLPTSILYSLPGREASLHLAWSGVGTWAVKVIGNSDWANVDITDCNTLLLRIYSTLPLAASSFPSIGLNGNGTQWTNAHRLASWLTTDLPAGLWMDVVIPLSDFTWTPSQFYSINSLSIEDWGELPAADFYIGEIVFQKRSSISTALVQPNVPLDVLITTTEGGVLARFEGQRMVTLLTADGRVVDQTTATGSYSRQLLRGIYLLHLGDRVHKIMVQ